MSQKYKIKRGGSTDCGFLYSGLEKLISYRFEINKRNAAKVKKTLKHFVR
jgi:hypothetical protein